MKNLEKQLLNISDEICNYTWMPQTLQWQHWIWLFEFLTATNRDCYWPPTTFQLQLHRPTYSVYSVCGTVFLQLHTSLKTNRRFYCWRSDDVNIVLSIHPNLFQATRPIKHTKQTNTKTQEQKNRTVKHTSTINIKDYKSQNCLYIISWLTNININ